MPFIITAITAIGKHPEKAVIIMLFFLYNNTAGDNCFLLLRNSLHPLYRFALHAFGKELWLHTKARTEHFRQNNYLCWLLYAVYLLLQHGKISLLIFPMQLG